MNGDATHLDNELVARAEHVLAPTYARADALFAKGEGARLFDSGGRDVLDFSCGIAVSSLGHGHPAVLRALREAAELPLHVSNLLHSEPQVRLAESLCERSFADRAFFCNSGTEAVEAAIKFARVAGGDAREIVYFSGSFHGRSMGALAATDRPDYRRPFEPLPAGYKRLPFNDAAALEEIGRDTALAIVEPIQGERGVREADAAWLRRLEERCRETGTLFCVDEIQSGLSRSGTLWAHEHAGLRPDMMTLAKPLAGGLPIGAVLMSGALAARLRPGMHGSTFGGGPFVTHVAAAVFDELSSPEALAHVERAGKRLRKALEPLLSAEGPAVGLRGRGLMLGLEVRGASAAAVMKAALEEGLLVIPSEDPVVRLYPPLCITDEELDEGARRLAKTLEKLA